MFFLFVLYGNHALNKVDNWTKTVKDFAVFYAGDSVHQRGLASACVIFKFDVLQARKNKI